jgi:hypothetical protein
MRSQVDSMLKADEEQGLDAPATTEYAQTNERKWFM